MQKNNKPKSDCCFSGSSNEVPRSLQYNGLKAA